MNDTLLKALIVFVPVSLLFAWSAVRFWRRRESMRLLQLVGAGGLVMVALVHICEALQLFPFMGWGSPQSAGHYLDLLSALVGLALFPLALLLQLLTRRLT